MLNYVLPLPMPDQQQGNLQHFDKPTVPATYGTIYPADQLRGVLLGTMAGDETIAYQYGRDPERDLAGWSSGSAASLADLFPYHYESTLDVVELVPGLDMTRLLACFPPRYLPPRPVPRRSTKRSAPTPRLMTLYATSTPILNSAWEARTWPSSPRR
jgi:hypothetical protein